MNDLYSAYKDDADYLNCVILANELGGGYTADILYNLPLNRYKMLEDFVELKITKQKERLKKLKK